MYNLIISWIPLILGILWGNQQKYLKSWNLLKKGLFIGAIISFVLAFLAFAIGSFFFIELGFIFGTLVFVSILLTAIIWTLSFCFGAVIGNFLGGSYRLPQINLNFLTEKKNLLWIFGILFIFTIGMWIGNFGMFAAVYDGELATGYARTCQQYCASTGRTCLNTCGESDYNIGGVCSCYESASCSRIPSASKYSCCQCAPTTTTTIEPPCWDSDGGKIIETKGYLVDRTSGGYAVYYDQCTQISGKTYLREFFCISGGMDWDWENIECLPTACLTDTVPFDSTKTWSRCMSVPPTTTTRPITTTTRLTTTTPYPTTTTTPYWTTTTPTYPTTTIRCNDNGICEPPGENQYNCPRDCPPTTTTPTTTTSTTIPPCYSGQTQPCSLPDGTTGTKSCVVSPYGTYWSECKAQENWLLYIIGGLIVILIIVIVILARRR